nr:HAD-IA family hydrolase [Microbacterium ulmi]
MQAAAALFDMDGTLVDSTAIVETLWTEFAERHSLDAALILGYAHGRQSRDTISHFLPADAVDAATAELLEQELTRLDGVIAIPGAAEFITRVGSFVPVAIVTSAPRALAELRLRAAGVPIPDVLVSGEDVQVGKPAPDGYQLAARRLGVEPEDCLAFEDAEAGLAAALAAGTRTVVVGGYSSARADALPRLIDFTDAVVDGAAGRVSVSPG